MKVEGTFTKLNKHNLVDQVLVQLQETIQSEKYSPGDKLPTETELMKLLNVGRSTIREAIRILVFSGLLEVRQGDGTYIRSSSMAAEPLEKKFQKANSKEMNEAIQIMDIQISALAAERRTMEDLQKIKHHLDKRNQFLKEKKYDEYLKSDLNFHMAICEATHNSILIDMYKSICNLLNQMLNNLIMDTKDYYEENILVHKKLYSAIAKQNAEDAKLWAEVNIKLRK